MRRPAVSRYVTQLTHTGCHTQPAHILHTVGIRASASPRNTAARVKPYANVLVSGYSTPTAAASTRRTDEDPASQRPRTSGQSNRGALPVVGHIQLSIICITGA